MHGRPARRPCPPHIRVIVPFPCTQLYPLRRGQRHLSVRLRTQREKRKHYLQNKYVTLYPGVSAFLAVRFIFALLLSRY